MARLSMISAADLKAKERFIAAVDSSGLCALASAASDSLIGLILDGGSASGDPVSVASHGEIAWGLASAGITAGAWLTTTAQGDLVTTTTDLDSIVGRALTTADDDGDMVKVIVCLGTLSAT